MYKSVQPARVSFFRSDLFQNWYFSWGLTFAIGKSNLEFLLGARKQRGKYGTLSDIAYWYFCCCFNNVDKYILSRLSVIPISRAIVK